MKNTEHKFLLTMVDIGSDAIDFKQLITKEPSEVLTAMKTLLSQIASDFYAGR
jgi:hypothetical protein